MSKCSKRSTKFLKITFLLLFFPKESPFTICVYRVSGSDSESTSGIHKLNYTFLYLSFYQLKRLEIKSLWKKINYFIFVNSAGRSINTAPIVIIKVDI